MNAEPWKSADEVRAGVDFPDAVAESLVALARKRITEQGHFTLTLSGGSTPERLYRRLAEPEWRSRVDWTRTEIFQGDERAVGPDHPDSNWGMAARSLLDHVPIPPGRRHRMEGERDDLEAAAAAYEAVLARTLARDGELDLVLLGLGDDGHTASLFPGTAALEEDSRLVVANAVPQLGTRRLTLSYPALRRAREVWFLVTGEGKAEVAAGILREGRESGSPASRVHPVQGRVVWWLDGPAGRHLGA